MMMPVDKLMEVNTKFFLGDDPSIEDIRQVFVGEMPEREEEEVNER